MQVRKRIVHTRIIARGATLNTSRIEVTKPSTITALSAPSEELIQNRVGAYQIFSTAPINPDNSCR